MRSREEILKDNGDIMSKPTTTGLRNSDDQRRLAANNVELIAILHQEIFDFKDYVEKYTKQTNKKVERYAREADKISRSNRLIALISLGLAALSIIIALIVR